MNRFYITTPIYYVNDKPHIGTAFCTIAADTLNRYHKLFGEETYFLTGTDEHGQKAAQAAEKRGMSPQAHCDDMVQNYKRVWEEIEIDYNIFFRTTDDFHKKAVQACLQQLFDKGEIYPNEYEGWYSVSEEIFYTEKDLVDGKSPQGREVTKIKEKNYFFKMSKYQQALIDHIEKNPKFIQPDSRRNEVLGFLRQPLGDLCISRPKSRMSWGIELPFDKDYVTYVWFDALLNYATAVGYQQPDKQKEFQKWWVEGGAHHLVGKDIITTHAVYWTTMLMALGAPLPKQIFAHGWILNKDNQKMSKSVGEVISPLDIKNIVGTDGLRYFLMRDVNLNNDAPISQELVINRVNSDLANNLGNLLSRSTNLIEKFYSGQIPTRGKDDEAAEKLKSISLALRDKVKAEIEDMRPSAALEQIVLALNEANRYLEEKAPWKTVKTDLVEAGHVLVTALESLRICSSLLLPVMPSKAKELLKRLGIENVKWDDLASWQYFKPGARIEKGTPLFPRIEVPK